MQYILYYLICCLAALKQEFINGASLIEPHINGLYGAGCYGVLCHRVVRTLVRQFWPPGCRGPHLFAPVYIMRTVWLGAKMAATRERFEFSQGSASTDHYIVLNDSSSPTLPTINDIRCEIRNTSDYYSCTIYALQFQDMHQRGWLKHGNNGANCLCVQAYIAGIGCYVSMVLEWQLNIVCCRPWLQSLAAHCHHSFCTGNAVRLAP